jgi:hypothetical protein
MTGKFTRWREQLILTPMREQAEPQAIAADPVIEAYKREIDRAALRENLTRSYEQRFLQLMELQRFADELRRRGRREPKTEP